MADTKKIIGENIRHERLKRNISAEELACILNISSSFVGLIERGQRGTNIDLLIKICEVFQLNLNEIVSEQKMILCENKNDEYNEKISAVNSLVRALNIYELDFVIATIKNLYNMKNKKADKKHSAEPTECFY